MISPDTYWKQVVDAGEDLRQGRCKDVKIASAGEERNPPSSVAGYTAAPTRLSEAGEDADELWIGLMSSETVSTEKRSISKWDFVALAGVVRQVLGSVRFFKMYHFDNIIIVFFG